MWMWLGELDTAHSLGGENLSCIWPLYLWCLKLDVSSFPCGEGIAERHHFWLLSTFGLFLQQDLPWINVLSSVCLKLRFLFWAKLTILDFSPNFKCTLLTFRVWVPELCSMIHESTGALQSVQERQDPGWGPGNVPSSQQAAGFPQEKVLWALKGKTTKDECV